MKALWILAVLCAATVASSCDSKGRTAEEGEAEGGAEEIWYEEDKEEEDAGHSAEERNTEAPVSERLEEPNCVLTQETCDALDNDCDGMIDEDLVRRCWTECDDGVEYCEHGAWIGCTAEKPEPESCNSKDDDCDGSTDENLIQACTNECGKEGMTTCTDGIWKYCEAESCQEPDAGFTEPEDAGHEIPAEEPEPAPPCEPSEEICDGLDNDCDGRTDEGLRRNCEPICGANGTQVCTNGEWSWCEAQNRMAEICDGRDNDCDGMIDENIGVEYVHNTCGLGAIECVNGQLVGAPREPAPETCNGLDDDCDGRTDDVQRQQCDTPCGLPGARTCDNGIWLNCEPIGAMGEVCDGADNDCDGATDENLQRTCNSQCELGTETCENGRWINCTARQPAPEICDGENNDCDGRTDEDLSRECVAICGRPGSQECINGRWDMCRSPDVWNLETCDGIDNNCDGQTDEGLSQHCRTICGWGTKKCENGQWGECDAQKPEPEVCDGRDNDCDGSVDRLFRDCHTGCGFGQEMCTNGEWSACSARRPTPELCDGMDNNCNDQIDENLWRDCPTPCGRPGIQHCTQATWQRCLPVGATQEICDSYDNDCDGLADEGLTEDCANECDNFGIRICDDGAWSVCHAEPCQEDLPEDPIGEGEPEQEPGGDENSEPPQEESGQNPNPDPLPEDPVQDPPPDPPDTGEDPGPGQNPGQNPPEQPPEDPPQEQDPVPEPPLPAPPEMPTVISPANGFISTVQVGTRQSAITLSWTAMQNADSYEYMIRWGGTDESGSVIESRQINQTSVTFQRSTEDYGIQFLWKVRSVGAGGQSEWTQVRDFFFSYAAGTLVQCTSASCPNRNAWYQVSRDIDPPIVRGMPAFLILDYVNAACGANRNASQITFEEMSGYARSARFNGCPPR